MTKQYSRIGLILSLLIHGGLIGGGWVWLNNHQLEKTAEYNALSMEVIAALLEQPPVAVSPAPVQEVKEPEQTEDLPEPEVKPEPDPDAVPDPTLKPKEEKRKEHRRKDKKEKREDKPKKRKPERQSIKALEQGPEVKQGIVAKAISGAAEGDKVTAGVVGGQKNGSQNSSSISGSNTGANGGNADALSAYKAALQRALQRRANNAYPQREKMMRKTGTVTIKFAVLPSGAISNVIVVSSSGNSNLDAAAVRSAESVKMPPPPAGFPPQASVPVKFSIE